MDINAERKRIRDHIGTKCTKPAVRETIDLGDGVVAEVRQPTGAQRDRIMAAGDMDLAHPGTARDHAMSVQCALECLYVPGVNEHVYEAADQAMLENLPAGTPWLSDVARKVFELIRRATEAGKTSAATPAAASSSPSSESLAEVKP